MHVEEQMNHLMYPGGHKQIIEYPIFRELLSLPIHEIYDNNVDLHEKHILYKLYIRLINYFS